MLTNYSLNDANIQIYIVYNKENKFFFQKNCNSLMFCYTCSYIYYLHIVYMNKKYFIKRFQDYSK